MGFETDFFYIIGPVFFGFFFQALMGMGGGLICVSLLSLCFSPHFVIPLVALLQLSTGFLILHVIKRVDWHAIKKALPFLILGASIGSFLLPWVSEQAIRLFLGIYILLELIKQRFFKEEIQLLPTATLIPGGALMNGMFGMGGPLFVLYLQRLKLRPQDFRATMLTLLFCSNLSRLPSFYLTGQVDHRVFVTYVLQLPFFILAMRMGHKLSKRLKRKFFFAVIQIILLLASTSLLTKAIIEFF